MRVMRDGRSVTVEVTSDGAGLVSHAGTALVAQVAEMLGLTAALSRELAVVKQRRRGHDPGRVIRDLAVMLVDGGGCVSDLGVVREQDVLFGAVASDSTAFREILVRADTAGATHGLVDYCREARMRFSIGYELTEKVRGAILTIPGDAWVGALDQDGSARKNGEVTEITGMVDLSAWPEGSRLVVRRERPHPGAQCRSPTRRRVPLPSDPHRPGRHRHRRLGVPPPPARPRRGPHP